MDKKKIFLIGGSILGAGGLLWAAKSALSTNKASKKLHVLPQNFKFLGISKGNYRVSVDFKFYSTASTKMEIKIISINAYYNNNELGFSVLNNSKAVLDPSIQKGVDYIKNIEILIPLTYTLNQGIVNDLINANESFANKLSFEIEFEVNGFRSTEKINFNQDEQLGLVAAGPRNIKPGTEYNYLFPDATDRSITVKNNGSVDDTVLFAGNVVKQYYKDTAKLAKLLKGKNLNETLENIFEFSYNHIQYHLDRPGVEELRTPARSWHDRKRGVDCDDFTIFVASLLYNLKIPFIFRITKYDHKAYYQHIYVVVKKDGKEFIIDPVVDTYNYQKRFTDHKDFTMKELGLAGLPIEVLSGAENETDLGNLADVMFGTDLLEGLDGLGAADEEQAMLNYLIKTRKAIRENPELVSSVQNPEQMLQMFDKAIQYWNTPQRDAVLEQLAVLEDSLIEQGNIDLHGYEDDWEEDLSFSGIEPEDPDMDYLYYNDEIEGFDASLGRMFKRKRTSHRSKRKGRVRRIRKPKARRKARRIARHSTRKSHKKKGFFRKVASGIKKGIKKTAKAIVKVSPVVVAARQAFLLSLRTNAFHVSDKLSFAYMSASQATNKGISQADYNKIKEVHAKVVAAFTKMGGNTNSLKKAILSGKRKNLRGFDELEGYNELEGFEGLEDCEDIEGLEGVLESYRRRRGVTRRHSSTRHRSTARRRIVSRKQAKVEQNHPLIAKVRSWLHNVNIQTANKRKAMKVRAAAAKKSAASIKKQRDAFIVALRKNPNGITSILYYGYMPAKTAIDAGFTQTEYNTIKKALSNTVYAYQKELKGNPVDLKNNILRYHNVAISGIAGLNGLDGEISDLITTVASWLKTIDLSKLKARRAAKKKFLNEGGSRKDWRKKGKKEFKESYIPPANTNQTEPDNQTIPDVNNKSIQIQTFPKGKILSESELTKLANQGVNSEILIAIRKYGLSMELINYYDSQGMLQGYGIAGSNQKELLINVLNNDNKKTTSKEGFLTKAGNYVKEHKTESIIAGAVLVTAATATGYAIYNNKKKKEKAKKISGKRKTAAPAKSLSGVKKVELN